MSVQVSQFDYSAPVKQIATYRYRQVPADSPATASLASTWNCSFTLPRGSVYNLSRSFMTFSLAVDAAGANNSVASMIDMLPIQSFRVRTERGVLLMDLQDAHILSRARGLFQSKDEFRKQGKFFGNFGAAHYSETSQSLVPAGKLICDIGNKTASATNGVGFKNQAGTLVDYCSDSDYRQWLVGAANTATTINYRVVLSDLIGLTSIDKDLFHANEALIIEVVFLPVQDFMTRVDASGVTNDNNDYGAIVLTAAHNPSCTLQLAIQSNNQVAQDLITLVNSQGLKINYPYVWLQKRSTGAVTEFDDIYKLNISRGKRLQRVLYALGSSGANHAEGKHQTVNDNVDVSTSTRRIRTARSSLNAVFEMDSKQDTALWFEEMKNSLGDALIDNIKAFRRAGFLMKDYTSSATVQDWKEAQTQDVGLSLIEPIDVGISYLKHDDGDENAPVGVANDSYIYAICQRGVAFLPTGVSEA